ncbi:DUF3108 domain-containing protein [Pseudidiomarina sediminum]|uniref:DUF3108 domain-containing protein n=1 Tax=Pseudidiomarina sediminum TaxID=431675 RepID=A0A432Z3Q8_9GAMM|nr:DUF3108 domain-containing protein [Pseudidiomarina sediminum]RUO72489.1 DUF3108 domain-containing protein [Pseudidiomarina sediminum]
MKVVRHWLAVPLVAMSMTGSSLVFAGEALASEKAASGQAALNNYHAIYEVQRGGSDYGEAMRKLESIGEGQYRLLNETQISFLFLSDVRRYDSRFAFAKGQVEPLEFHFKRSGTGRNKGIHVSFDSKTKQVKDAEADVALPVKWHEALMDEASMLEQLRYDLQHSEAKEFSYHLVDDKGEYDKQKFVRGEVETFTVPYGEVKGLRVERIRENSRRETTYWFAPEMNYVLVKMQQRKEGDEVATLLLEQLD